MVADVGHIIVVDDDPSLRQMVTRYLEENNVPTRSASNRSELNRCFAGISPSLIILDLRLGQDDGLDVLREIRSHSDVPIIITTGHRPDEIDRIVGLELGVAFRIEAVLVPARFDQPRAYRVHADRGSERTRQR